MISVEGYNFQCTQDMWHQVSDLCDNCISSLSLWYHIFLSILQHSFIWDILWACGFKGHRKKYQRKKLLMLLGKWEQTKAGNNRVIILVWNNREYGQVLEDRACAPSYSWDTKDLCLKPFWANSVRDPISKKPITKKGLVEWLKVEAPTTHPSIAKKKLWIW
jgi:hypothetical protein